MSFKYIRKVWFGLSAALPLYMYLFTIISESGHHLALCVCLCILLGSTTEFMYHEIQTELWMWDRIVYWPVDKDLSLTPQTLSNFYTLPSPPTDWTFNCHWSVRFGAINLPPPTHNSLFSGIFIAPRGADSNATNQTTQLTALSHWPPLSAESCPWWDVKSIENTFTALN